MTNDQHPDDHIDVRLRRAADHLMSRGSEYREQVMAGSVLVGSVPQRARRLRSGVVVVSAVLLTAGASVLVLGSDGSATRLRPASTGPGIGSTGPAGPASSERADWPSDMQRDVEVDDGSLTDPGVSSPSSDSVATSPEPPTESPGGPDGGGPLISDVRVPSVVAAGTTATFRWRAVDPDSVSSTGILVGWASGIYTPCGFGASARRLEGTDTDGVWEFSCLIPTTAVSTEYSVEIRALDALGNWSNSSGFGFSVTGGPADAAPPAYSDIRVVGVARSGEVLTTTWTLFDPSGIDGAVMWIAGPSGGFTNLDTGLRYAMYETMVVTSQCSPSGETCTFTQTVQLDPTAPAGSYSLWLSATDGLGNKVLEQVFEFPVA